MSFADLGLSDEILAAVTAKGYDTPSPIQEKAIPAVLEGYDVMAAAQTGTGKTAGFTLPILQQLKKGEPAVRNQARALILTPTRELAAQVHDSVVTYGKGLRLKSMVVFGGVKINPQMQKLCRGVDVLVATPGRLIDLYNQNAVKFDKLEVLVLDEADRMLDMGFIHDIKKIMAVLPKKRQNLMFSATFSDDIKRLAKSIVNDPVEISVTPPNATANTVKQWLCPVDKKKKAPLLTHLIKEHNWHQVLVFSRTKRGANKLAQHLADQGIKSAAIHGNKSQGARTRALAEFKNGKTRVLVATDIAARGLDIEQLPQVVNFDLPNVPADYVHRIGRTGRAGAQGQAVSLVSADEFAQLSDIESLINKEIEREYIEGFDPIHDLPISFLKGGKKKKPKKPKKGHQDGQRSMGSAHKQSESKQGKNQKSKGARKFSSNKPKPAGGAKKPRRSNPKSGGSSSSGQASTTERPVKSPWKR